MAVSAYYSSKNIPRNQGLEEVSWEGEGNPGGKPQIPTGVLRAAASTEAANQKRSIDCVVPRLPMSNDGMDWEI
jgi:hypothetical protein